VIDEKTADGQPARVSKSSVCGSWGGVAGSLRYFADRHGIPRASIEGTQIPLGQLRRYARRTPAEFVYDASYPATPLVLKRKLEYFGFVLERASEPIKQFPPELAPAARRTLAEAVARSEAQHMAVRQNRAAIEEVREMYRRSGGQTPRLGLAELTAQYEAQLNEQNVNSLGTFRNARLTLRADDLCHRKHAHNCGHYLPPCPSATAKSKFNTMSRKRAQRLHTMARLRLNQAWEQKTPIRWVSRVCDFRKSWHGH
jgi:hypothetical protein